MARLPGWVMARLPGRMTARARPTRAAPSGRGAGPRRDPARRRTRRDDGRVRERGSRDGRPRPLRRRDRRGRRGRRDGRGSLRGGALGRDVGTHASLGGCFPRSLLRLGPLERLELLPPRQEGVLLGLLGRHVRVTIRPAGRRDPRLLVARRTGVRGPGPRHPDTTSPRSTGYYQYFQRRALAHPRQTARLARRGPLPNARASRERASCVERWRK